MDEGNYNKINFTLKMIINITLSSNEVDMRKSLAISL